MQLTVADVSELLGLSPKQIYRFIDEGEINCNWFHNQPRFNRAELLEWATARRIPIAIKHFLADEEEGLAVPSLADGLKVGGIFRDVPGRDRESVLRNVVGLVPLPEMDKETLVEVLLAQATAGSTGIGHGIAIPHARQPIVMAGMPASISLCFLVQPVDFSSVDGALVHTLFLMISTTVRGHLQTLAKLSTALSDTGFKSAVLRRAPQEEILAEALRVEAAFPRASR